jgi:hypothetical protein
MKFKYKANYFLATLGGGIEFDDKWEFETKKDIEIQILEELGAEKVVIKKTTKK